MDHDKKDQSAVDSGHFPDTGDTSAAHVAGPTQAEIAARAHQLWLEEGQPHGSDERHWLQAEQELRAAASAEDSNERADSAQA
jgi:hypothetical protein